MNIGLNIYFDKKFYQKDYYKSLFDKFIAFRPITFTRKNKQVEWNESKHYLEFSKYSDYDLISVRENYNSYFTYLAGRDQEYREVEIIQDSKLFVPSNSDIESQIAYDTFLAAYLYNEEYKVIQSTSFESNYSQREFPPEILATIRNTPYKLDILDRKKYDTKFNPGSTFTSNGCKFMVAWKMWFGKDFFEFVPKGKILSFPYASEIKELPNGQVYVQLYDNIAEPYIPENVFRQWKWKEWLDYDGLREKYGY